MNPKYIDQYLILPAEDGTRADTKLAVEYSDKAIVQFLEQGYLLINNDDFQKLIGNSGKPYSIAPDGTLYETPVSDDAEIIDTEQIEQETIETAETVIDLYNQIETLEARITTLEGGVENGQNAL